MQTDNKQHSLQTHFNDQPITFVISTKLNDNQVRREKQYPTSKLPLHFFSNFFLQLTLFVTIIHRPEYAVSHIKH